MGATGLRVAIIGGGIGGLCLGLALREQGLTADIYESAPELTEIGAAVAQSANATRLLARLGLVDELAAVATTPTELIYRHWRDGRRIAAHPVRLDSWYESRFGAPYFGIHRADLQRILGTALAGEGLHLGCHLTALTEQPDGVRLEFANGRVEHADVVIGADGVRSTVRKWVTGGADDVVYSGTSGFRGIVPTDRLPSLPDPEAIQFWMGPDAHLLHYAIGGDAESVNFLAVVEGPAVWPDNRSVAPIAPGDHLAGFEGWHPAVTEMIDSAPHSGRWGLFVLRPLTHWHRGRVVLLGDAAHAMLPHHGQGANTTIEDAFTLAALLADASPDHLDGLFRHYQRLRRARTRQVQRSSWVTNSLLHLPDGPAAQERDLAMGRVPQNFGWIHEFDVEQSLARSPGALSTAQVAASRTP